MAGRNKQVLINTLEEPLTSDFNRIGQLAGKAVMDMACRGSAPFAGTPRDMVRSGLEATIAGAGTLPVTIGAGELLRYNSGVNPITSDASDFEIGTLLASTVVPAATAADATNPRVDIIYATMSDLDSDSTNRNQLVLPARTIAPVALNKTRRGALTLARVEGTPASTPLFPTVPAGGIALWGVYVPATATAILDDHLMDMRVYWTSWAMQQELTRVLSGLRVSVSPLGTDRALLARGLGYVTGSKADNTLNRSLYMTDVLSAGESFVAGKQYDFYLAVKGSGVPVGKTVPDGVVLIATADGNVNPPGANGQPSVPLNIAPLAFAAANAVSGAVLARAEDRMTFVGTLYSGATAALSPSREQNSGLALDRAGDSYAHAIDAVDGRFPGARGWIRPGKISWLTMTTIGLAAGAAGVVDGTPFGLDSGVTFDLASNRQGPSSAYPLGTPLTASTWYYLWLRKRYSGRTGSNPFRGPVRDMVPIISKGAPGVQGTNLDPETGFTGAEYIFVGSAYVTATSVFRKFWRGGDHVLWADYGTLHSGAIAADPAVTPITPLMPGSAQLAIVTFAPQLTNTAAAVASATIQVFPDYLSADILQLIPLWSRESTGAINAFLNGPSDVVLPKTFGVNRINEVNVSSITLVVYQKGYIESAVANDG